jgi:hypothetical protein
MADLTLTGSLRHAAMADDPVSDWLALATLTLFIASMGFGIACILS